jgi:hypothetical protein
MANRSVKQPRATKVSTTCKPRLGVGSKEFAATQGYRGGNPGFAAKSVSDFFARSSFDYAAISDRRHQSFNCNDRRMF